MLEVKFHEIDAIANNQYKYAVIVTRYENKWVFVQHRDRTTWEFPGGRREEGEAVIDAAHRELMEETGASVFEIKPVSAYSVTIDSDTSYGLLCYAEAEAFDNQLQFEIARIDMFEDLPQNLTYPEIVPVLFKRIKEIIL